MNPSIRIGSVFGITIRVHWLFLVMAVFFLQVIPPVGFLLLFGSVFLHELGHSLVAKGFGIRVLDITFWPLGGMARMSQIPESPKVEGLVAIAGPAVNFVLAGLTLPFWILTGAPVGSALWFFVVVNLVLGVFNLIPAFPMDGGRILRALLGLRFDWLRATELAVRIGRVAAVLMLVFGVIQGHWMLVLIALFVWWAGMQELIATRMRRARERFGPLGDLADLARAFAGERPGGPQPEPSSGWSGGPSNPGDLVEHGPRRPSGGGAALGRRGISEEDVERLERYRGRLGRGS